MAKINSHNEWDPLREIIVGTVDGATACLEFRSDQRPDESLIAKASELAAKAYPSAFLDEVQEDLEDLCDTLRKHDVRVLRPGGYQHANVYSAPGWSAAGNNVYNMRDLHLVVGNSVVESPSPGKHRLFEASGLYDLWYDYFDAGFRWISGPTPRLTTDYAQPFFEDGKRFTRLTEDEIMFDAANTVRMGRDLLYLVSSSGNYLGAKWLQSVLGDDYRVHTTEGIYRSSHIDSTVLCLKPGLVLLSADRVDESNCPALFDTWDKIFFEDIEPYPDHVAEFQKTVRDPIAAELDELGVWSDIGSMSSPWIGMNVLSINPETVLVDARQTSLIRTLEQHSMVVVPIRMRHSYVMKGGLHCCTLDTVRDSTLESYFD
jgi:glycine amidinotransferase